MRSKILLFVAVMLAFGFLTNPPRIWAAEQVLHVFHIWDGVAPNAGVVFDAAGNLYGTTSRGGVHDRGSVFRLSPNPNGGWTESLLYSFSGREDGGDPYGRLIFDAAGNLYGTTAFGGNLGTTLCVLEGCGTVFRLTPGVNDSWTEAVLYAFGGNDGAIPISGLISDSNANLYGTTTIGGGPTHCGGCGTVFELSPSANAGWTETVLHEFDGRDGSTPYASLSFDATGSLYGTTTQGGSNYGPGCAIGGCGTVFKLTPGFYGWTEEVLHSFNYKDGAFPYAGLIFDRAGNLYGATRNGGDAVSCGRGCGVLFELKPGADNHWTETVIQAFNVSNGAFPEGSLIFDAAGNLYGTTTEGGNRTLCHLGCGTVFKLALGSNGRWTETVLSAFNSIQFGYLPTSELILDPAGNLYGTTLLGGDVSGHCAGGGCGLVFKVTPGITH